MYIVRIRVFNNEKQFEKNFKQNDFFLKKMLNI